MALPKRHSLSARSKRLARVVVASYLSLVFEAIDQARVADMDKGVHVPGGAATTGFAFWALSLDQRPRDDTTDSMVRYYCKFKG